MAGELFEPQTLQTVVSSCELPEQRGTLEASQVGAHLSKHGVLIMPRFTPFSSSDQKLPLGNLPHETDSLSVWYNPYIRGMRSVSIR